VHALVRVLEAELSFRFRALQSLATSVPLLRAERDQYFDTLRQVERACKLLPESAMAGATEQLLEVLHRSSPEFHDMVSGEGGGGGGGWV
jgi:hypothetical protein